MIKLNNLSLKVSSVMKERFGINKDTSIKALVMRLSVLWREADEALGEKECSRFVYSQLELVLADIILFCIMMLRHTGVRNIENLILRRLRDHEQNNKLRK